jgi:hypothetical protein
VVKKVQGRAEVGQPLSNQFWQSGGMNEIKNSCRSGKIALPRAVWIGRVHALKCPGKTPSSAPLAAAPAFSKDKWNAELTKDNTLPMMHENF